MGPLIPKASFHTQTKMWRTIATDTLSAMHFASRLSPFSSSPSTPLASVRRTILAHYHLPSLSPSKPQSLSLPKTLVPFTTNSAKAAAASSLLVGPRSGFCLVIVRCVSSVSSAPTLEWNEPVSCSEVGDSCSEEVVNGNIGTVEDDAKPSIPVRAYFFSTRFVSFWVGLFYLFLGFWEWIFILFYFGFNLRNLVKRVCGNLLGNLLMNACF